MTDSVHKPQSKHGGDWYSLGILSSLWLDEVALNQTEVFFPQMHNEQNQAKRSNDIKHLEIHRITCKLLISDIVTLNN